MPFSFEKVWFGLSLLFLSFGYGFASHAWGLFPKSHIENAWRQARSITASRTDSNSTIFLMGYRKYDREGVRLPKPGDIEPGLTLLSSSWEGSDGWNPELRLVNREGKTVHRWRINRSNLFQGGIIQRRKSFKANVHGTYLLEDGNVVVNLEYVGMARLDACGDVVWTLKEGNHHSISRAGDGSFWVPGVSSEPRSGSEHYSDGFPGLSGKKVWLDRILHVSEDGKILDEINVLDVIYENDLERYIPKALGGAWASAKSINPDITHLNDVEPLSSAQADEYPLFDAGDLLVSLRNLNLVFVLDPETMNVKWHSSDPYVNQHDPDFVGNGWIGVFDNNYGFKGGKLSDGSRIIFLNPRTDSIEVRFPTQYSEPFYTATQGKWQLLGNGNMLLSETTRGRAVEVSPDGKTVWEWVRAPVDNSRVPLVTKASRHDLTREDVADWPCSSIQ